MKYAIRVSTQEEYDQLMDIYEKKGWKWLGDQKPKESIAGCDYNYKLTIAYEDSFGRLTDTSNATILTLKQLLEMEQRQPKRGDWVMVRDREDDERYKRIYLATIEGSRYPYICVEGYDTEKFAKGEIFWVCTRQQMKPLEEEKTELTLQEIADKFQIPVDQLRIKE